MAVKTYKVDLAEYLETESDIVDFLNEVLATGSEDDFIRALNVAARAYGMAKVAEKAGVGRESLYKSLKPGGKPQFKTISKITKAFGLRLAVAAA